jgi:NADH:ubiquinone oxidoreductase subunit B-like Fe-S oxidoreductase
MYNVEDGVDRYIPGCATSPELIIDGVVKALEILEEKTKDMEFAKKLQKAPTIDDGIINRRDMPMRVGEEDEKN